MLLLVCLVLLFSGTSSQSQSELFLSVTYRNFLPAWCIVDSTGSQASIQEAWQINRALNSQSANACSLLSADTNWKRAFQSGIISGHVDFEAKGVGEGSKDCKDPDPSTGVHFPNGTCVFEVSLGASAAFFPIAAQTLAIQPNGLGRIQYCSDVNSTETSCGLTNNNRKTQSRKGFFDLWFEDNLIFNRRIGGRLKLNADTEVAGRFVFDGNGADDPDFPEDSSNAAFFGPLDRFKTGGSRELKISDFVTDEDIINAPAWPQSAPDEKKGFWFTTEVHTTFEYRNDSEMVFIFSGDDDFWTFVNNKMVIDVGGTHDAREKRIDLNFVSNSFSVAQTLGLVHGEIYTLDIFHTERQRVSSNFKMTTTLFAACNVVQSGTSSFSFQNKQIDVVALNEKFVFQGIELNDSNTEIFQLQRRNEFLSSSFIFTKTKENVIRGFVADFLVKIDANTNGFAFVIQAFGVDDYPKTSGATFNIAGLTNSVAVVFDLCLNFTGAESSCFDQEVRVHFPDNPEDPNSASESTKRVFSPIARNLKRDEFFPVQVAYYGGRPDFLEVYVNQSLYLRQTGFRLDQVIGSGGAHLGLTSATSVIAANIHIQNFKVTTVQVDPKGTQFNSEFLGLQTIVANGKVESEGYSIVTKDLCENQLESGTLQRQISAKYFELLNTTTSAYSNGANASIEVADITDNNDGTYAMTFKTRVPGHYGLAVSFGAACQVDFNVSTILSNIDFNGKLIDVNVVTPVLSTNSGSDCFFQVFQNGDAVVLATPDPFTDPDFSLDEDDDRSGKIILLASIGGGIFVLACIASSIFVFYLRKWQRERKYVKPGTLYRLDLNTNFSTDNDYNATAKKVLQTQRKILELQAKAKIDSRETEIMSLQRENDEMKGLIKQQKQGYGDESATSIPPPPLSSETPNKKYSRTEF